MTGQNRCLVMGAEGFIGSHLVDTLLAQGCTVRGFDRIGVRSVREPSHQIMSYERMEGDFLSTTDLSRAMEGMDVCFHLISTTLPHSSNADPAYDVQTNLVGTLRLLDAAIAAKVKKIVYVSSGGTVYGPPQVIPITELHPNDPTCSYAIVKLAIEKYLALYQQMYDIKYVSLRLANPYGERQRTDATQGAIGVFMGKAMRDESIEIWGDGSVVRDFVHVEDAVRALTLAGTQWNVSGIYNVGSGIGHSINEILDGIRDVSGKELVVQYKKSRGFDVQSNVLCIQKAASEMLWVPRIALAHGLTRTWAHLQRNK